MNDARQQFLAQCKEHILSGGFTELLTLCQSNRDIMSTLTAEEKRSILTINHANDLQHTRGAVRVLFTFNPYTYQKHLADTVFEERDYFLQQVLLFHGVDLTSSRKEYEMRLENKPLSPQISEAYDKIAKHTGLNIREASENNMTQLRQEVGQLTPGEQEFQKQFQKLFEEGKIYLCHESGKGGGGDLEWRKLFAEPELKPGEELKPGPELYAYDELKRRNLRFPGQSYKQDRDIIGNTEFVFTGIGIGNPLENDKTRRTSISIPVILFPEHCFFVSEDWLHFANEGQVDLVEARKKYGDDTPEKPWEWDQQKKEKYGIGDYDKAVAPFRGPSTFDKAAAEKTILYREHIIEGIALKAIKHSRDQNIPLNQEIARKIISAGELLVPNHLKFTLLSKGREDL